MANGDFLSVALIGPNDANRLAITRELSGPEVGVLRDYYQTLNSDLLNLLIVQKSDVMIIDLDSDTEGVLQSVRRLRDETTSILMVYSTHPESNLTTRALQAGAHELLTIPLPPGMMSGALIRAMARRTESSHTEETLAELLVFFGVKGGVGVTTIATNFALLLARESKKKTLLIDLDLPLGDVALNLGLAGQYSTLDALENATRLDANLLSRLLQSYRDNLYVLAAPGRFVNTTPNGRAIDKLIAVARRAFDYIVVDSGSRLNFLETDLYRDAACIYMVVQTGVPELRNANRLVGQFPMGGRPMLQIVVNRYNLSMHGVDEPTVQKALTRPIDWKIPNDYLTASRMQNTATPLALENTPISKILRRMARTACGIPDVPEKKHWLFSRAG
jgi:pilus assembly protein CpaE